MKNFVLFILIYVLAFQLVNAVESKSINESLISGVKARLIGPAVTGGRISDFAVDCDNPSTYFVAVASGNVWKTTNAGITFKPVFDDYGSYSIGCITIDPNNKHTVWVGTGENNSQRSVAWGDGIYKSTDGGESWTNMGLKKSEHIGKIIIDPRNSDVIYVAAQGPLWGAGGDRGLYKSTDGGKTWEHSLKISDNTGVSDIVMDTKNPDVLYATSYQRRRHTWTLIDGGPESAIYKSVDAGKTWSKINKGLPAGDLGRIGLAIAPSNPDILYVIVEAEADKGGFYRSTNRGANWERRNNHVSSSPQYYQELLCDPKDENLVYSLSTYTMYSEDGGKTFKRLGLSERHVDDHALWINPKNSNHLLIGGDGGVYESYDRGANWRFIENLPIVQFYRIQADNAEPFYNVYGGTQDNNSLGGPSQTTASGGLYNHDWIFVVGGDGYEPQIDPENPDIIYGQWQYGNLVRFDKKSGEVTGVKPYEEEGEELRWNWDTPVIISPHNNKRLYIAANKVFRSDDRGNSWTKISDDLSRNLNRNELKVMDKVWSPEAVAKNASTSLYGNIVSLVESPVQEDLIWIGTDDGLIQVTTDAGKSWTKIDAVPNVPKLAYVSDIYASRHNANTAYALFNNHKNNDFKPYIYKTTDLGKSWKSISANLPDNEPLWTIEEDTETPNLLFLGTEFSLYYSINGGDKWLEYKNGLPTIAVRDLDIQERESDLVIGTFGRSVYVIDNYSPIRELAKDSSLIQKTAYIFPIKDALMFQKESKYGRNNLGANFYRAENPPYGATFTYYVKDAVKSKKDLRKKSENELTDKNADIKYPTFAELREEDLEEAAYLLCVIKDAGGNSIRTLKSPMKTGINRIVWDLSYPSDNPVNENSNVNNHSGVPCIPGKYSVQIIQSVNGVLTELTESVAFNVKLLNNRTLPADDITALDNYRKEVQKIYGTLDATKKAFGDISNNLKIFKNTISVTEGANPKLLEDVRNIELKLADIDKVLNGDNSISSRNGSQTPSLSERIDYIIYTSWETYSSPTQTNIKSLEVSSKILKKVIKDLKTIRDTDLKRISDELSKAGSPWTPDRFPEW